MTTFWIALLAVQVILFLPMGIVGLWVQRRQARMVTTAPLPAGGVSVILPIKGLDPGAAEHYRHWLGQDVAAPYEVIFSLQDPGDPVIPILQDLIARYGAVSARILVNPVRPGLNGKSSNLFFGVAAAGYEHLVMADSDIDPPPALIDRMLPPLGRPEVGVVACLPTVRGATNLSGGINALALNVALSGQWAMLAVTGKAKVASGACFAIRRQVLAQVGGVEAFGGYLAEDAEMAKRLVAAGKQVVLGPTVVLEQGDGSWPALLGLLSRGAYLNLYGGMLPMLLQTLFGLFAHLLVLVVGLVTGNHVLVVYALLVWGLRTLVGATLQIGTDPRDGWRFAWVMPLMELLFGAVFLRALFSRTFVWRGVRYRVEQGGRIVHVG